ncbi:dTMP kinase [bacterium]|nr:dTMP kinase [bacterium]
MFITLEGGEGSGKSTQMELLAAALRQAGLDVLALREPGGTHLGELLRDAVLNPEHGEIDARAELLLYEAARAQLVAERIKPALATGGVVIDDRHADSSMAYQGYGRGLPLEQVDALNVFATAGLTPDLTLLFDLDPQIGVVRATAGGADRLEAAGDRFHERVRSGFLRIAANEPERFALIDAAGTPDEVFASVLDAVRTRLPVVAVALARAGL